MRGGGLLAGVIIIGSYIGFEAAMISKAGYRMEANYIYPQMVSARTTAVACSDPDRAYLAGFDHLLASSRERLLAELAAADASPEAQAREMEQAARESALADIAAADCASPEIQRRLKQFRIYADKAPRAAQQRPGTD